MFVFGPKSLAQLDTVEEPLRRVMLRAIEICTVDFSILEGARTVRRQWELYGHGRSIAEMRAAGIPSDILAQPGAPKVTWTLKSKHFVPEGKKLGRAIDAGVFPYVQNAGRREYQPIYDAVMKASAELKVKIRSGMDWDGDGHLCEPGETDLGHFELV